MFRDYTSFNGLVIWSCKALDVCVCGCWNSTKISLFLSLFLFLALLLSFSLPPSFSCFAEWIEWCNLVLFWQKCLISLRKRSEHSRAVLFCVPQCFLVSQAHWILLGALSNTLETKIHTLNTHKRTHIHTHKQWLLVESVVWTEHNQARCEIMLKVHQSYLALHGGSNEHSGTVLD